MRRDDEMNREILKKLSELTEENKAAIIETLLGVLLEPTATSSDRQLDSEADP